jgi:hypothetical protein
MFVLPHLVARGPELIRTRHEEETFTEAVARIRDLDH